MKIELNKSSIVQFMAICLFFLSSTKLYAQNGHITYFQKISIDSLKKHTLILSSDKFAGRGTGQHGGDLAANYIAKRLEKYDIKPIAPHDNYFQFVPMHASITSSASNLKIFLSDTVIDLQYASDYVLYKLGQQTFIPKPLPLVFVGYGISAPEYDYNDYQSVDVSGKIAVFLDGEPTSNDSNYFEGPNPSIYSYAESKQRIAMAKGASGSIMIPLCCSNYYKSWNDHIRQFLFEDVQLAYSVSKNLSLMMRPEIARILFRNSEYKLEDVDKMVASHRMTSFPLRSQLSFKGVFQEREFYSPNVIGLIQGKKSSPNDEYIIISAHYDHLGIGPPVKGDSIYNGMSDNAIGVAALLEITRVLSQQSFEPNYSILLLFMTGEEKGLLGSTHYIDNPVVPLYKTIANINIDGIAMFDTFEDVVGVGSEYSTLHKFLEKVCKQVGLYVSPMPYNFISSESFARSDQITFAKAGIPSILIAEGYHYHNISTEEGLNKMIDWAQNIYHSPFDEPISNINYYAVNQHVNLLYLFCESLAMSDFKPEWKSGAPFINARLRSLRQKY